MNETFFKQGWQLTILHIALNLKNKLFFDYLIYIFFLNIFLSEMTFNFEDFSFREALTCLWGTPEVIISPTSFGSISEHKN